MRASDRSPEAGGPTQQGSAEEQLAARYSPIVYLKRQEQDCDSKGEAFYPAPVEIVLGNPEVVLKDADGKVVAQGPTASDLFGKGEDYYLDFPGDPRKPGCRYEQDFKALAPDYPPTVYAHIVSEPETGQLVLQYWFFYYFNDWNNKHEGDWEMIQIIFNATSYDDALRGEPASVAYAQHEGGETAAWNDDKVRKEDGRPAVFVAAGSHAAQFRPDIFLGKGEQGSGFGCDDASEPSRRIDPEVRLIPDHIAGPGDPFAWVGFEGRWGQKESGYINGPTGPATKEKWREPLAWQDGLRDSSMEVPEDTIGPNAARVFCGVVAGGSELLFARGLYVVLGLAVAAVVSIAAAARRTQFRPVIVDPLRQRRRFGQIIRAAFRVERERMGLFLGIGAAFVPFGAILTAIQWLILEHPPIEPLLGVVDHVLADGAVALAVGGLGFVLAQWLVVSAVIGALGEIEAGRHVGVVAAYRLLRTNLWTLFRARLREVVVVLLLALTIVGMPWALRRAVSCGFLEQAIILGGSSAHDAPGASARIVSGQWWRTLGVTTAVAFGAVAVGPIVGMGILLLTPASLSVINLVSSIVYVALMPYAAVALTMLYFDLDLAKEAPARRSPGD